MRVRLRKWGVDHRRQTDSEGRPLGLTRCNMRVPPDGGRLKPRGGRICVQCRRDEKVEDGEALPRQYIRRPHRARSSERARKRQERERKERVQNARSFASRHKALMRRRQARARQLEHHRTEKDARREQSGFGRFLRRFMPRRLGGGR